MLNKFKMEAQIKKLDDKVAQLERSIQHLYDQNRFNTEQIARYMYMLRTKITKMCQADPNAKSLIDLTYPILLSCKLNEHNVHLTIKDLMSEEEKYYTEEEREKVIEDNSESGVYQDDFRITFDWIYDDEVYQQNKEGIEQEEK